MLFFSLLVVLTGCAGTPQSNRLLDERPPELASGRQLTDVPFFPQKKYQCGPAALATTLQASGVEVLPEQLIDKVYIPLRQGSLQIEMLATARRYQRIAYPLKPSLQHLIEEIAGGKPVLVLQNLGPSWYPKWHYAVVVGYDLKQAHLILRSGTHKRWVTPLRVFENTWRRADYWGVVLLKPGEHPANVDESNYFLAAAAFAKVNAAPAVEEAYRAGLSRWPQSRSITFALANHYYSQQRLVDAESLYRKVLLIDSSYAPAYNNLAQVKLQQNDLEAAQRYAQKALALGGKYIDDYRATLNEINKILGSV